MIHSELIRVRAEGGNQTISFSTDHRNDVGAMRQVAWHIDELIDSEQSKANQNNLVSLDFQNIDRISSEWLNELIDINRQARSCGVRLVLLDVQQPVRDVFAVTRLERMFEFSSSSL